MRRAIRVWARSETSFTSPDTFSKRSISYFWRTKALTTRIPVMFSCRVPLIRSTLSCRAANIGRTRRKYAHNRVPNTARSTTMSPIREGERTAISRMVTTSMIGTSGRLRIPCWMAILMFWISLVSRTRRSLGRKRSRLPNERLLDMVVRTRPEVICGLFGELHRDEGVCYLAGGGREGEDEHVAAIPDDEREVIVPDALVDQGLRERGDRERADRPPDCEQDREEEVLPVILPEDEKALEVIHGTPVRMICLTEWFGRPDLSVPHRSSRARPGLVPAACSDPVDPVFPAE